MIHSKQMSEKPMRRAFMRACFLVALSTAVVGTATRADAGAAPLRVGVVQTFFHDLPEPLVRTVTEPFITVMRETTGLSGELIPGGDPMTVAGQLCDGKLQFAVFHAFEYARAKSKYEALQPLMVAVHCRKSIRAHILVRRGADVGSFADLKGKNLAVAKRTEEHCRLYVDRECQSGGTRGASDFFAHVVRPANVEAALDELSEGKVHATVVDTNAMEFYKDLKPGRFARLTILAQSEAFPPLVVAYKQGGLDTVTLGRIRDGLHAADKTEMGRAMLKLWKLSSFEPVPTTFGQMLTESLKAYPLAEARQ
jgi:ABC-type phosphate/phosphonate transport system substrate-binding protein